MEMRKKTCGLLRTGWLVAILIFIESLICFSYAETISTLSADSNIDSLYTDKETNVTFTIPDNWKPKPLWQEDGFIDAKFVPDNPDDFMFSIMYGSADMFGQEMKDAGYSRADINNALVPTEFVASIMNTDESSISVARYNNCDYYTTDIINNYNSDGLDVKIETIYMVRFENGFMYAFQFFGSSDSTYFGDFEALLNSAIYPADNYSG